MSHSLDSDSRSHGFASTMDTEPRVPTTIIIAIVSERKKFFISDSIRQIKLEVMPLRVFSQYTNELYLLFDK